MPTRHAFQSAVADAGNAGEIGPSEWNEAHLTIPELVPLNMLPIGWTNQPAALTEFLAGNSRRAFVMLQYADQFRFWISVTTASASATADVRMQYSTDGSTWAYLDAANTGAPLSTKTVGNFVGAATNIATGAKIANGVWLRMAGTASDSVGDPQFGGCGVLIL